MFMNKGYMQKFIKIIIIKKFQTYNVFVYFIVQGDPENLNK